MNPCKLVYVSEQGFGGKLWGHREVKGEVRLPKWVAL